jgi:hypothetical protein
MSTSTLPALLSSVLIVFAIIIIAALPASARAAPLQANKQCSIHS